VDRGRVGWGGEGRTALAWLRGGTCGSLHKMSGSRSLVVQMAANLHAVAGSRRHDGMWQHV
jgi:hypothetical protein